MLVRAPVAWGRETGSRAMIGGTGVVRSMEDSWVNDSFAVLVEWDFRIREEGGTTPPNSYVDPGLLVLHDQPVRPTCPRCGRLFTGACLHCWRECRECGGLVSTSEGVEIDTRWYHRRCVTTCTQCHITIGRGGMITIGGSPYCPNCVGYCAACGAATRPGLTFCNRHSGLDTNRVGGYHHTRPAIWLGGQDVVRDGRKGYHLGFELEITSSDRDVSAVKRWAEKHLGNREALDCKSDSSVQGFEIATQPMTPEFFESVNWDSLMKVLNRTFPPRYDLETRSKEPTSHGLHVHIGRVAFEKDDLAVAAFCYLLGQGTHLEKIARREPYHYCRKVRKPASAALLQVKGHTTVQGERLERQVEYGRDAINLTNTNTIEIRAFRSTRDADHLRAAVRMIYLTADYVRFLRGPGGFFGPQPVGPKALHWSAFLDWVSTTYPDLLASVDGSIEP